MLHEMSVTFDTNLYVLIMPCGFVLAAWYL